MSELTTVDKVAAYGGGGLVLLGVVGVGILEILAGAPAPVTAEGQAVTGALVSANARSYVILLGLLIWGVYPIYKIATSTPARAR